MTKAVAAASIDVTANITKLQKQLDRAESRIKRMEGKARQSSKGLQRSFTDVSNTARNLSIAIAGVGFAVAAFAKSLSDAGIKAQGLDRAFRAATGSAEAGAKEFGFVRREAERLGLDLVTSAEAYAKLSAAAKGTVLEGQNARDIFTAVSEASRVLSLSAEQTGGALTAIEQIISKGRVSAEELRGQLGERLPGAFQIAARSIGVTTAELDELLKQGKLAAEDLLPSFAAELRKTFGPEVPAAANDAQAAYNRFSTAIFELKAQIASSGVLDALASLARYATSASREITTFLTRIGLLKNASAIQKQTAAMAELNSQLNDAKQRVRFLQGLQDRAGFAPVVDQEEIDAAVRKVEFLEQALARAANKRNELRSGDRSGIRISAPPEISGGAAAATATPDAGVIRAGIERATQIRLEALRRQKEAEAQLDAEFAQRKLEGQQFNDQELINLAAASAQAKVIAQFNAEQAAKGETGQALNPEQELELLRKYNDEKLAEYERFVNERARISAKQAQADQAATRAQIQSDSIAKQSKERLVSTLTGLLGVLGGKSKAAAIALIALEKAKALADNKMYTIVAMQKARALLGPGLGDAEAARIAKIGAVNAGLIAATGLGQAIGALTGGGGAAIGSYSSGETLGGTDGEADGAESRSTVQIIFNGDVNGLDSYVEEKLVPAIRDATKDRDLVLIDPNSRNAADIRGIE